MANWTTKLLGGKIPAVLIGRASFSMARRITGRSMRSMEVTRPRLVEGDGFTDEASHSSSTLSSARAPLVLCLISATVRYLPARPAICLMSETDKVTYSVPLCFVVDSKMMRLILLNTVRI